MTTSAAPVSTPAAAERGARPAVLVGALGVMFGDIGTSPIYAFRESLRAAGDTAAQATLLGILSLVFWAVVLVVALEYVLFVMRADNQGEGGTMALISLALPAAGRLRNVLLTIGLGGASASNQVWYNLPAATGLPASPPRANIGFNPISWKTEAQIASPI